MKLSPRAALSFPFLLATACGDSTSAVPPDEPSVGAMSSGGSEVGTGGDDPVEGTGGDGNLQACAPGTTQLCIGISEAGPCDGVQSCSHDGAAWEACLCPSANSSGGTSSGGTEATGGTSSGGTEATGGTSSGGTEATGGTSSGGTEATGGTGGEAPFVSCLEDGGVHSGEGHASGSDDSVRYAKSDVKRGNTFYRLITNGWGDNWYNHDISWVGTQMAVNSFSGDIGNNYSPAGYPTIYVGNYSNTGTSNNSPLPKAISALTEVNTGVRWSHPANSGEYNVAYDVWLSNNGSHSGYFMVWLRDPPGQRPAGDKRETGRSVPGVEGVWDIWAGDVFGKPIINYVRAEGTATKELSFDVLTFIEHAKSVGYTIPGAEIMSVAIGFEIWQGPVSNLKLDDFCVDVN